MRAFDDLRWGIKSRLGQKGLYSWQTAIGADSVDCIQFKIYNSTHHFNTNSAPFNKTLNNN